MDIERLKELREEVFEDYKAYMVKNLKDEDGKVYPSTVPLDECSPIGKDLLKLIDEAIARQSVKSEEVAEAIDILIDWDNENFEDRSVGIYIDSDMKFAVPLAVTALQAYRKPTDESVRDAIGYIESVKGYLNDVAEHKDPQTYASLDLAITALKAYQPAKTETASCEWCEGGIDTASLMDADMMMRFVRPVNYCPNCGKAIKGGEKK